MKKIMAFIVAAIIIFAPLAYAGSNLGPSYSPGPAPNSGDGIPDGSGFEDYDDLLILESLGIPFFGPGPAPNSGDGIPDGSGFEEPPQGSK